MKTLTNEKLRLNTIRANLVNAFIQTAPSRDALKRWAQNIQTYLAIVLLYALVYSLCLVRQVIPTKEQLERLGRYALVPLGIATFVVLFMLVGRAIDIEADAQDMVLEQHQAFLEKRLPSDVE